MTPERLANFVEARISDQLRKFTNAEVHNFTPSVVAGRRYIGFEQNGKAFSIEINITELED